MSQHGYTIDINIVYDINHDIVLVYNLIRMMSGVVRRHDSLALAGK